MANRYKTTGAGTKIEIYPQHDCLSRTPAPSSVATTGAVAAIGATSISVTFAPALTKTILAPMWATAVDAATGKEVDFKITADVEAGDTTLTVVALANDIPSGSKIDFPVTFPGRSSCNWQPSNQSNEMQTLDEAGWISSTPTTKGGSFQLEGYCWMTLPAWRIMEYASRNGEMVWARITYPKPACPDFDGYDHGDVIEGFFFPDQGVPIDAPAESPMMSSITLKLDGEPLRWLEPGKYPLPALT
jgi:hypothetical protein